MGRMSTSHLAARMPSGAAHALVVLAMLPTPHSLQAQERPIALNPGALVRLEARAPVPGGRVNVGLRVSFR
jgi:hypothetical protein